MTIRFLPTSRGRRLHPPEPPPARHFSSIPPMLPWTLLAVVLLSACGSNDAGAGASAAEGTGGASLKPISAVGGSGQSGSANLQAGAGGATDVSDSGASPSGGATGTGGSAQSSGGAATGTGGSAASGTGGAPPAPGTGACCSNHGGKGCSDATIQACVCQNDPRCCSEKWDDVCVALVGGLGCGTCKTDCCTESTTPGCADSTVESCVCAKSADCCNVAWDSFCVLLVTSGAAGGVCGTCN